jgi:radical SAM protein with 4Fe4S-binding SPASM domain
MTHSFSHCRARCAQSAPAHVWIHLTEEGNFKCIYCYAYPHPDKGEELSYNKLMDIFKELDSMNVLLVRLLGGEPLLRKDIIQIIEGLRPFRFSKMLTTNGSLVTDAIAKALYKSAFCLVNVSLDGPKRLHEEHAGVTGCHSKVIGGIEHLKRRGLRVAIISVLNRMNVSAIEETLRIAHDLNVDVFKIIPLVRIGRARENTGLQLSYAEWCDFYVWLTHQRISRSAYFKNVELVFCNCNFCTWEMFYPLPARSRKQLLKKAWGVDFDSLPHIEGELHCFAGIDRLVIMANGDVYPCEEMYHIESMKAGNVTKDCISHIWKQSSALRTLRSLTRKDIVGPCGVCTNPYCSGTNRGEAYLEAGSIMGSDMRCLKAKAMKQ